MVFVGQTYRFPDMADEAAHMMGFLASSDFVPCRRLFGDLGD